MSECRNCKRLDCPHHLGGRSEADYQSCLQYTAARAEQAEEAVLRVGRDPQWAAIYAWCDDNRDPLVKSIGDQNGEMEREIAVLAARLKVVEAEADRSMRELTEALQPCQYCHRPNDRG